MRIEYAIPCRYVEVNGNLGTIVGAGIDTTWVPQVPAPIQAMLAVRAVAPPEELAQAQEHRLQCHVEGPDGTRVGDELRAGFNVDAPDARQNWLFGMFIPIGVQWEAAEEGTYTVHVQVDASEYPVPMHVVLGPPPGASPGS